MNQEDDNKTYLFTEEEASSSMNSLSIRQIMMNKVKGFNSHKTEYNEVFMINTNSEAVQSKWVYLIKWLIKQHLNVMSWMLSVYIY